MATNPMQRKANNYLLIGILGTLLVTGAIIAFLIMQLGKLQSEKKKEETAIKSVSVLTTNVKSGEEVTEDMITTKTVSSNVVSADAKVTFYDENDNKKLTKIAKIDLAAGTIITENMLSLADQITSNDLRKQEYNMVILPSTITSGDYIDVRLRLSNGVDFIVVSKKQVDIPVINDIPATDVMTINLNESEIQIMAGAIIEAYIDEGSMLYATTYVEPGLQTAITPTYVPSGEVQLALSRDPNIEKTAKEALFARYNTQEGVNT